MLGGGSGFAGNTAAASTYGASSSGVSSYGGSQVTPMTAGMDNGLRNIPSRQMRTATVQAPQGVDPDVQQVLMEATRLNNQKINESGRVAGSGKRPVQYPPLPPTDLSPHLQGQQPPGGLSTSQKTVQTVQQQAPDPKIHSIEVRAQPQPRRTDHVHDHDTE